MTEQEAIQMFDSRWWESAPVQDVVLFQLTEPRLCMPFGEFHRMVEETLDRSVFTHEFARPQYLLEELYGNAPKPTLEDIMNLIPTAKRIIVVKGGKE